VVRKSGTRRGSHDSRPPDYHGKWIIERGQVPQRHWKIEGDGASAVERGFMNTLDLLGRKVRYNGETGVVVSHSEPGSSRRDHLAAQRGRSVTIRIEGALAPHFVEVTETDLESIEVLDY
jgi:hypothetical protein